LYSPSVTVDVSLLCVFGSCKSLWFCDREAAVLLRQGCVCLDSAWAVTERDRMRCQMHGSPARGARVTGNGWVS